MIHLKYLCNMLLKTLLSLRYLFFNVEFELIQLISQHRTVAKDFSSTKGNAAGVSKWDEYWNYGVLINLS